MTDGTVPNLSGAGDGSNSRPDSTPVVYVEAMRATGRKRLLSVLAISTLTVTACGGGGDDADSDPAPGTGTDTDTEQPDTEQSESDDGEQPPAGQAVNGALVSVLDLGLGLYGIDRETGESFELSYEADWFTDRNNPPFVVGDRAYTLIFREIEDLDFVNETSVAEFDLTTGTGREILAFGPNSDGSESLERTTWNLIGVGGDAVWLEKNSSDAEGSTTATIVRYSISTGEQTGEVSNETVDITTDDGGSCSASPRPIGVDSGGTLYVSLSGIPGRVDDETLEPVEIVGVCFNEDMWLSTLAGSTDLAEFTITDDGSPVPEDQKSFFYDDEPVISNDSVVVADDAIWWVFNRTPSYTDDAGEQRNAIIGGVARLDLATSQATVFPIGDDIGEFLDQEETGFTLAAMSQVQLQVVGADLWFMDIREEQPLRRLDSATGEVSRFEIPVGEGNDFVEAELIPTDPEGVWLSVSRRVITSAEGEGRSTTGMSYVDQVDPDTGEFVRSIFEGELTGFGN